jgi:hypothetical protein
MMEGTLEVTIRQAIREKPPEWKVLFMRIYKKTMSFIAHICACSVVERREDDKVTCQ